MSILAKAKEAHETCKFCKGTGMLHGGAPCDNLTCELLLIHEATLTRLESLLTAIAIKGGTEHYPTEDSYNKACEDRRKWKTKYYETQAILDRMLKEAHGG